ncbi:MAG: CoA transferase [Actinomycetia bacterium]|nr:CoA transferase [Actinomycetes bacterium]
MPDTATSTTDELPRPLDGLKVLDFSRVVAGPFAGRMLSDLGADVVKVEPPDGDTTRIWGHTVAGLSGFFTQQNAGKRNTSIDIGTDEGRALVKELVAKADIVIENFRPGVMAKHGLGWHDLSAVNPGLVMLSISGFGQTGADSRRRAYAPVIHAESGFMARQARFDDTLPSDPMFSFADSYAGLHGLVGVLAAIHMRDRTGIGQHLDISMLHSMVATDDYAHNAIDDHPVVRLGGHVFDTPWGATLLAGEMRFLWYQASRGAGVADPSPPDADLATKQIQRKQAIGQWLAGFDDRDEMLETLDELRIAHADVLDQSEALDSPTLVERGAVVEVEVEPGIKRRIVDSPYRFSDAASGVTRPAAHRGVHNTEVMVDWLEMTAEDAQTRTTALLDSGALTTEL